MTHAFFQAAHSTSALLSRRFVFAIVAVATIAVFSTAAQWGVGIRLQEVIWEHTQVDGIDPDHLRSLAERAEAGDAAAMEEMLVYLESGIDAVETLSAEERAEYYERKETQLLWATAPILIVSVLLLCAGALVAGVLFLALAVAPDASAGVLVQRSMRSFFPLIATWFWAFVCSWAWIPVLGIVPAIIKGPRYALAGVLLLRDGTTVRGAVRASNERTRGHWTDVFVSLLVVSLLCAVIVAAGQALIAAMPAVLPAIVRLWASGVLQYAACAIYAVFLVALTQQIAPKPAASRSSKGAKR